LISDSGKALFRHARGSGALALRGLRVIAVVVDAIATLEGGLVTVGFSAVGRRHVLMCCRSERERINGE